MILEITFFLFFTARVRSTMEGNIYTSECLSVHHWWGRTPSQVWGGGTLSQVWVGGTPSQVWVEGTPSQVWWGRYPVPGLGGGIPQPRSGGDPVPGLVGGTLSQVWMGGTPCQVWMGGTWGTPPTQVWMLRGTPHHDWMGYPLPMTGWGIPPPPLDRAA